MNRLILIMIFFNFSCSALKQLRFENKYSFPELYKKQSETGTLSIRFRNFDTSNPNIVYPLIKLETSKREKLLFSEFKNPFYLIFERENIFAMSTDDEFPNEMKLPAGSYIGHLMNDPITGLRRGFRTVSSTNSIGPFLFPQIDTFIGIAFGYEPNAMDYSIVYEQKINKSGCYAGKLKRTIFASINGQRDLTLYVCPKLEIKENQTTFIDINIEEPKFLPWQTFFQWIPGTALLLAPIWGGVALYKSEISVNIIHQEGIKKVNKNE